MSETIEKKISSDSATQQPFLQSGGQVNPHYQTLFEHSGTAVALIDVDRTLISVNQGFEKISGYSKNEIEGKMNVFDFIPEEEQLRIKSYHEGRRQGAGFPARP